MKKTISTGLSIMLFLLGVNASGSTLRARGATTKSSQGQGAIVLRSNKLPLTKAETGTLKLDGLYYETEGGRMTLPAALTAETRTAGQSLHRATMPDGRQVWLSVRSDKAGDFTISLGAEPDAGVKRWGLGVEARTDEYFTGLMERVVDGPQRDSWAPGIKEAMNLRGQKVEMIVKPTTSIYAPFFISSRGYSVFVKGTWPGVFD